MDQVKVALAILKKQHFWIVRGLIIIPSIVVWKMAVGSVDAQFETRKGVLDGQLSKIQGIKGDSTHPNQKTIDAIDGQTGQLNELVFGVWENLYDNQQKLNPWPDELGPGFINMVNVLPEDKDIPTRYREDYQVFIANHLPTLDEIIDRLRPKELDPEDNSGTPKATAAEMGMGMGMGMEMGGDMSMANAGSRGSGEYEGIVEWADSNRSSVRAPFIWNTRPSTARIRVAQEDLWIYEALLRVIADTNASATGNFNAAVKKIEYMNIGQAAGGLSQGSSMSGGGMSMEMGGGEMGGGEMGGGEMGGMDMGGMDMGGMDMGGGEMGGMTSSAVSEDARLLEGRYVDKDGKPLGASAPPPYAEFKMMPVRLRLLVDQGRISDLLVNCANCTMPIDVRRVSLWSQGGSSDFSIGGAKGMGGMSGGMGMGMGDMGMGDMGMGSGMEMGMGGMGMGMGMGGMHGGGNRGSSVNAAGTRREQLVLVNQKDIPVEIEGIIYIFNKPAREIMGTGSEEGSTTAAGDGAAPPVEAESTPMLPTEGQPSETTPQPAAPAGAQPPVDTAPTTPASPTPPVAGGQGDTQPAATQPTAGEEPVTP